jgi:hypothetical protein
MPAHPSCLADWPLPSPVSSPVRRSRSTPSGRSSAGRTGRGLATLQDKELGEHFGWIDTSDDGFVIEAEWSVARTLGMGDWGSVTVTPGVAQGQLPGTAVQWRVQKNVPYIPAEGGPHHGRARRIPRVTRRR